MARQAPARPSHGWWGWLRLVLLGLLLSGVTGVVMVFPLMPQDQVVLETDEVAVQHVRAPREVTYESAILSAQARELAAAEVEPIYTLPDPAYARQQLGRAGQVFDYLDSVRADDLASSSEKQSWVLAVPELADLSSSVVDMLLALSDAGWDQVQVETISTIDQAMRREIREGYLGDAQEEVPTLVSLELAGDEATVAVALVRRLLVPNTFLDSEATAEAQAVAREAVGPVLRTFEANEIIVREGERVTDLDIEALDHLGLRQTDAKWPDLAGGVILAVVGTVLLFLYMGHAQPEVLWEGRLLFLLVLLILSFVVAAGLMVPSGSILRYIFPGPALAMLAAAAIGPHAGVAATVFLAGAVGVIGDASLETITYVMLGGLTAALVLGRVERMSALFRAGALVILVHLVVLVTFRLLLDIDRASGSVWFVLLAGVGNGGIAASLTMGGLFLVGPVFDIPTSTRLIELSRPDNPLLSRLLREAPATYHHSLMVANLAEQAAERIGADALLTRVGAYYHDVGKLARPYFFAENQIEGVNPHDRLDPRTSAEVIISHVKDGLEMARRYRLPSRVRAFIPEHHGTNWVSYLYDKAVQLAGDATLVDEQDFRHMGPQPRSKETALVMLADGCEAAVRAMRPTSAEEVAEIVKRVVNARVADGQLSQCDMTLRDLELAQAVFVSALKGIFHPRIQYPKSEGGPPA